MLRKLSKFHWWPRFREMATEAAGISTDLEQELSPVWRALYSGSEQRIHLNKFRGLGYEQEL